MNTTTTSATQPSTMNTSSPFARGVIIGGKRAERWSAAEVDRPLHWRSPRNVWLTADLFHENLPDEAIDRVFAVMALAPQHTFQVLTKRAERMREYCSDEQTPFRVARAMDAMRSAGDLGSEEVREIAGYPGYFASSHGFIYSEKRGRRRRMQPDVGEQGHQRVQLHREGGDKRGDRLLVHRVILETFVGPPPADDAQGRHRDGDPSNNAVSNLSWGGQDDNWDDSKRHGSHRRYSRLRPDQAAEIRRRFERGETAAALGRLFGISDTQARNIGTGKQWAVEPAIEWPLPNCWKGVSVEDQERADERIPHLLATPAAKRFISAEPLLGRVDLSEWIAPTLHCSACGAEYGVDEAVPDPDGHPHGADICAKCGAANIMSSTWGEDALRQKDEGEDFDIRETGGEWDHGFRLNWVIAGGESGANARPMLRKWARSLRDQCQAAGVAFFYKQTGEYIDADEWFDLIERGPEEHRLIVSADRALPWRPARPLNYTDAARLAGDRPFEHQSDGTTLIRVGKAAAGRLLDGRTHDEFPQEAG